MTTEYIYGINPAFEVARAGRRKIHRAYLAETAAKTARASKLAGLFKQADYPVETVSKGRLFELCRTTEHQGVALAVDAYPYASFQQLLKHDRLLLLDNIEDPQNVGAILRSAEIFGWNHVLLSSRGTAGVYPSVVKASAGASEYLRIANDHAANHYVRAAIAEGFAVVALDGGGKTTINDLKLSAGSKWMLVIGGEHRGVGQFILNEADYVVRIPTRGHISSLNASVAAGIVFFRFMSAGADKHGAE